MISQIGNILIYCIDAKRRKKLQYFHFIYAFLEDNSFFVSRIYGNAIGQLNHIAYPSTSLG